MIIHAPETKQGDGRFTVSARIEYMHDHALPDELWFSVDEEHADIVSTRADLFLCSLVRLARAIGEDIEVRGALSPQLVFGMRELLKIYALWSGEPNRTHIRAVNPVPAERPEKGRASCNISGGIDSFYALWTQLPENEPIEELQVSFGIYGIGLSSPTHNENLRREYLPKLKEKLASIHVPLMVVDSNVSTFTHPDPWIMATSSRAAMPHLFSSICSTHFHPSSYMYLHTMDKDSRPVISHLYSTEGTRVINHGAEFYRFEKILQIKDWEFIHDLLQVCNFPSEEHINDCRCQKCMRTLLALEAYGVREKFTSFHRKPEWIRLNQKLVRSGDMYIDFGRLARYAWKNGRKKLLPGILIPMLLYKLTKPIKPLLGYKFW